MGHHAALAADLAPVAGPRWRSGSLRAGLRLWLARIFFGVAVLLTLFWGLAPVVAAGWLSVQMVAWIPEWSLALCIGGAGIIAIALASSRRGRWIRGFLVMALLAGPIYGVSVREFRWFASGGPGAFRVVFLNAQDPTAPLARELWTSVGPLEPDLLVVSNPGFLASEWRRLSGPRAAFAAIKWLSPVMVAVREGSVTLRTLSRKNDVRAVAVQLRGEVSAGFGAGVERLAVVDLPSEWRLDRDGLMEEVQEAVGAVDDSTKVDLFDLIVGDFNLTPRSPSLARLSPMYRDGFEVAGVGWGATWPRRSPMLRIDAAFVPIERDFRIQSIRTFDPGQRGHRGLVIDVVPRQPSTLN